MAASVQELEARLKKAVAEKGNIENQRNKFGQQINALKNKIEVCCGCSLFVHMYVLFQIDWIDLAQMLTREFDLCFVQLFKLMLQLCQSLFKHV